MPEPDPEPTVSAFSSYEDVSQRPVYERMPAEFTLKAEGRFLGPGLSTLEMREKEVVRSRPSPLVISSQKDTGDRLIRGAYVPTPPVDA